MGTNYYIKTAEEHNRNEEGHHIGKSSAGWVFSLCDYQGVDEALPHTWDEWKEYISADYLIVVDEYGGFVPKVHFIKIVEARSPWGNQTELRRHGLPGNPNHLEHGECIRHGEGTWDYLKPGFS